MALVGRDAQLRVLAAAFDDARAGRGRLVLVTGAAGMGKSELLTAAVDGLDATVLWGSGWEAGGAPAYRPWTQVLRGLAGVLGADATRALAGPDAPRLAHLAPGFGEPDPAGIASDGARFALFDAVAALLATAAARAPLVIVVDDLHVAGAPSALLLQFLARELRRCAVLLLAAYRPVEAGLTPGVDEVVGALESTATVLPLPGLDTAGIAALVGEGASPELTGEIARRTDGNPLFVTAVARLLAAGPVTSAPDWPVPAGIRQAIRARVGLLPAATGAVISAASVLGRDVDAGVLAELLEIPAAELAGHLETAARAELLHAVDGGRYRFAHDLVRETVHADLPAPERARRHARAVEVLGRRDPDDTRRHLARLAHHALAAVPVLDPGAAAAHADRAAAAAVTVAAFEEAAALYTAALAALEHQVPADVALRGRLKTELGAALVKGGDPPRARQVLAEAAGLARRRGDADALARAALLATERLDFNDLDAPALALLDEAAAALGGSGTALEARVLARRAVAGYHADPVRRAASGERAVAAARRSGDPAALAQALSARLYVRWGTERAEDVLPPADEIVALAGADAEREVDGRLWRLVALLELGELDAAEREVHAVDRLAESLRQPLYRLMAASRRSVLALLRGRAGEALELARRARVIGERGREPDADAVYWVQAYAVWQQDGLPEEDLERCERVLRALVAASQMSVVHAAGLVLLCLGTGRPEEARARYDAIIGHGVAAVPRNMLYLSTLTQLAQACAAFGDAETAGDLAAALEPYAGRCAVAAGAVACSGAVDHHLGLLAGCRGRTAEAVAHFTRAAALHRRMGAPGLLARTRLAHAQVLLAAGVERAEAAALLDAAAAGARELGLARLLEQVQATRPGDAGTAAPLAREGELWTTCWAGRSTRLRDSVGMHYLAALLAAPRREVAALDLARSRAADGRGATVEPGTGLRPDLGAAADERLDARARAAYRERLAELRVEEEQARAWNDPERAARIGTEIDFLARELGAALGLGGRARGSGGDAERARISVTRALRAAIARISAADAAFGEHLAAAVRTGTFCRYDPERATRPA